MSMQHEDLETIRQSALAAYNHTEPASLSSTILLLDPDPSRDGFVLFTPVHVKWRPHVTMRDIWVRVHMIIESYSRAEPRGALPSRARLRLAVEQGRIRDTLFLATHPLQSAIAFPWGVMLTWSVGSAMFADEPLLAEHEYMRETNIDVPQSEGPWSPND